MRRWNSRGVGPNRGCEHEGGRNDQFGGILKREASPSAAGNIGKEPKGLDDLGAVAAREATKRWECPGVVARGERVASDVQSRLGQSIGSRLPKSTGLGEDNLRGRLEKRERRVQSWLNSPVREGALVPPLALQRLKASLTVFCMSGECPARTDKCERRHVSARGIASA